MPEKSEKSQLREVADRMYRLGGIGDSIEIPINGENKVFTVVGIIGEKYGAREEVKSVLFQDFTYVRNPLIFISPEDASEYERLYRNVMTRLKMDDIKLYNILHNMYYEPSSEEWKALFATYNKYNTAQTTPHINVRGNILLGTVYDKGENTDLRLLYILSTLAMLTAVLSVYSVLRQVFIERKNNLKLLSRIGMSRRRIISMLGFECFALFSFKHLSELRLESVHILQF